MEVDNLLPACSVLSSSSLSSCVVQVLLLLKHQRMREMGRMREERKKENGDRYHGPCLDHQQSPSSFLLSCHNDSFSPLSSSSHHSSLLPSLLPSLAAGDSILKQEDACLSSEVILLSLSMLNHSRNESCVFHYFCYKHLQTNQNDGLEKRMA